MTLLSMLFKASLLMAVAAGVHALAARRASAATRHLVWTIAIIGLLLLPILSSSLPGWTAVPVRLTKAESAGTGALASRPDADATAPAASDTVRSSPGVAAPAQSARTAPTVWMSWSTTLPVKTRYFITSNASTQTHEPFELSLCVPVASIVRVCVPEDRPWIRYGTSCTWDGER